MSIDYDKSLNQLDEFLKSEKGQAFFENEKHKQKIQSDRYLRFEEWLKHNDFDKLLYRLIHEHDDEYREKCWHRGYEAYPNNKLSFIFDYLEHNFETVEGIPELESIFSNNVWSFKGYYFQIIYGQGCIYRIINKDDKRIILQV